MNAYEMLELTRENINEAVAAHWSNKEILRRLNLGQRKAFSIIAQSEGDWFITSTTLTPSSGVITLPSDCARPAYMEDVSNSEEIPIFGTVRDRLKYRTDNYDTYGTQGFIVGNTIEINSSSFSNQVKLWYEKRIVDMHAGSAYTSSGASTLIFDPTNMPKRVNDYYNNITVEVVDGTGTGIISTISDYVGSTYTATITGTVASGDHYGTVSQLPEEAHDYIVFYATCMCLAKPSSAIDPKYFEFFNSRLRDMEEKLYDQFSTRLKSSQYVGRVNG